MKPTAIFRIPALLGLLLFLTLSARAQEPGLLFYLSGDRGLQADYAAGKSLPNYASSVDIAPNGPQGPYLHCNDRHILSYWAHQNMYAQRGTLSFFWRASSPITETEFPIFRVGYSDHSSWDMVFLRIDWNGHGFDAFVTDVNLARVRTSYTIPKQPDPSQWLHFALAWDETEGIRFYIDGQKVGQRDTTVVLDAGLDQFGPHARIISPYQVQSAYNFQRGGDIDEIRVYDRMLDASQIAALSKNQRPEVAPLERNLAEAQWRDEWNLRYGWNRPGELPSYLQDKETTVRKVQILETYDLKRWWWKANDGIRETTWPGVYNRSRIIGRNDYFQLPDWDCYSLSGQQVRFIMPDEPWNHLEIAGGADGTIAVTSDPDGTGGQTHFSRPKGNERTFHRLDRPATGQTVAFTNNIQETPIGEFDAYYVHAGDAPQGITRLTYSLSSAGWGNNPNTEDIEQYILGRHPADERATLYAAPARGNAPGGPASARRPAVSAAANSLPLAHIVIPSDFRSMGMNATAVTGNIARASSYTWINMEGGLDGIRITIPALDVAPVADGLFPLNIRVKDPIWPIRQMLDFSFSVKPNEERVLWLDLRDRILPGDKPLYLTLAGGPGFHAGMLEGARIELVFKELEEAKAEHVIDRFTQVRDNYAMIVEENPGNRRLNKFVQFENDMTDLLRVDPHHLPGRYYWYVYNSEQAPPKVVIPDAPAGVPRWAHLQMEYLKKYREFIEYHIDHRQIENGEFGGGLSDDSDLGNWMPPLALMGIMPDKIEESVSRMMQACYDQGLLIGGMSAIQSDGLHTFEEGTNVIGQLNLLRLGDPKEAERLMEAARTVRDHLIGVNHAGHTHFRSDYFSATKLAATGIWTWSSGRQSLHLIPALYLGEFYGHEASKQLVLDMADGFLAHAVTTPDGRVTPAVEINFETDEVRSANIGNAAPVFWAAWRWTGDEKYLKPLISRGFAGLTGVPANVLDIAGLREAMRDDIIATVTPETSDPFSRHLAWQVSGDKQFLEAYYEDLLRNALIREYMNTVGTVWTDRFVFDILEIQRSRLGGIVQNRNLFYAGNAVSWRFSDDYAAEKVAILIPDATPEAFTVEFFNTDPQLGPVEMTGWDVLTGEWELTYGIDTNGDGKMDRETSRKTVHFGRGETTTLDIPANQAVIVGMKLKSTGGIVTGRPDLAIGKESLKLRNNRLTVTVHNLGGTAAPETTVVLADENGNALTSATVPEMGSADDLQPKQAEITLTVPRNANLDRCTVIVDPQGTISEIRKANNTVSTRGLR